MKFLLTGGYGYGNVGDEAQLAGILQEIRTHATASEISVLTPDPSYTTRIHDDVTSVLATRESVFFQSSFPPLYNIRLKRSDGWLKKVGNALLRILFILLFLNFILNSVFLKVFGFCVLSAKPRRVLLMLRDTNYLFVVGGGYLTEDTLSRLLDTSMLLIAARVLGTKRVVSGQTIGKLTSHFHRLILRVALRHAEVVSTRDPTDSIDALRAIDQRQSLAKQIMFTSDDALLLDPKQFHDGDYNGYVGLQLHFWGIDDEEQILNLYERIILQLRQRGIEKIVIFGMHKTDEKAINALLDRTAGTISFEYDYDYNKIISFIRQLRIVVSMKHHPLIFAMGGGVPVISINHSEYYRHKNEGALRNFGLEGYSLMNGDEAFPQFCSALDQILDDEKILIDKMQVGLREARIRRELFWDKLNVG